MRALVIDDSRAIRLILGQILKALKFEVIEAGHGLEAMKGSKKLALLKWRWWTGICQR